MFDIGALEVGLVGIVMLLVVGPNRFVHLAKTAGRLYKKMQTAWHNIMSEANQAVDPSSQQPSVDDKTAAKDQGTHES